MGRLGRIERDVARARLLDGQWYSVEDTGAGQKLVIDEAELGGLIEMVAEDLIEALEGGSGGYLVKINSVHPDSPTGASDMHMFQGDVFGNGSEEDATEEDVTIRIVDNPLGSDDFPSDPNETLLAVRTTQTWTDKNGDDVNEIVYEAKNNCSAQLYRLIITGVHGDSPTGYSEKYVFMGDVYEDGWSEDATEEGVTVLVGQLADGISDLAGIKTELAVRRGSDTWIDKNGTDVTETVYCVDVPRLI